MDFSDFKQSLQAPKPVYVLQSEQEHFKRKVYELCRSQIDEASRGFNWGVFDLEKDSVSDLINTARTLPWMGSHRWIYVRNAERTEKAFVEYLENPSSRTVMILDVKKQPRGWPGLPTVELSAPRNPVRWIMDRAKKEGYEIERQAAEALIELIGEDYERLDSELEKQILWEMETRRINLDSVLQMTRQAREYDVFALIDAIASSKTKRALSVLEQLHESGMSAPQILSMLYWNFRRVLVARELLDQGRPFPLILKQLKIWSYKNRERDIRRYPYQRLRGILLRLRETDRLCKTTSTDAWIHLERVVVDTCSRDSI